MWGVQNSFKEPVIIMITISKQWQHQVTIFNTNNLNVVIQSQVFLSHTNSFQMDLFDL